MLLPAPRRKHRTIKPMNPVFSAHLKELRERQNCTQSQLADRVGLDRSYISRIESKGRGAPERHTCLSLARILCNNPAEVDYFLLIAGHTPERETTFMIFRALSEGGSPLERAILALCKGWLDD